MFNKIILRLLHTFTGHDYEVAGFHNLYAHGDRELRHKIIKCDCGKEKYTHERFIGYER